jgi:branched-chain amino acid transport system substrate-binding protein
MKGKKVKKMMDFAILAAALVVTILGPYFYPNSALAVNEVVVGGVLPLTGGVAAWGIRNDWGHRYVFDIINAQGGIKSLGGAKIKYITLDTESKPEIAQLQAEKIAAGNVACILGATQSAASLVVSQVAERKEIPYITTTDLDPLITERYCKNDSCLCKYHEQNLRDKL